MNPRKDLAPKMNALLGSLEGAHGKTYWRSLSELAETEAFAELVRQEFPGVGLDSEPPDRRRFLTLMGASLALAGVGGCSVRPAPEIPLAPYVRAPEELVPGRPLFFATAMTLGGAGVGLLVESHMGRPTKVEGNPQHPASLGATSPQHQASVLGLYDPDRSQTVTRLGQTATWDRALRELRQALAGQEKRKGADLRLLTETVASPTLASQIDQLLKRFPQAKWHQYEPLRSAAAYQGAVAAFGRPVNTLYDFTKADVVVSLDADFLDCAPGNLRYVADFMGRRRVRTSEKDAGSARMNRLYVIETSLSCTGAKADHRLAVRSRDVEPLARALAATLHAGPPAAAAAHEKWFAVAAKDLQEHRGRCLVLAGDRQPAAVHLLAHAMNERLGNVGQTVLHTEPVVARAEDPLESIRALADDLDHGRVELLLMLGGNPAFDAPAELDFGRLLQKAGLRAHLSLYQDETSRLCQWHLPETHYLEAWGDTRAYDGTATITQPLIKPLYHGKSAVEVAAALLGTNQRPGSDVVKEHWYNTWKKDKSAGDFEEFWQASVHDGVVANTRAATKTVPLQKGWEQRLGPWPGEQREGGYELLFLGDPAVYDGRFANNGWLQEMPRPITRLTWDNAALLSPRTAKELGVTLGAYAHGGEHGGFHQPVVELTLGGRTLRLPAWVVPGQADGSVVVHLGYGRQSAGNLGGNAEHPVGGNAYALRTSANMWFANGLTVAVTAKRYLLACTQEHQLMENRRAVRSAPLAKYHQEPKFATHEERKHHDELQKKVGLGEEKRVPLKLYESPLKTDPPKNVQRWAMSIDLTTCVGCNACVVACQAENNIPVVGKNEVSRGREMHWLRVDRYNAGPYESPTEFYFQPLPCQQCEQAPCEYVCPVEATVHSADGLNDMVYQRCVGTRFCSNNCPYKVRRFNFYFYADWATESRRLQYNPDVTVRSRGVMEKCTYCVQRLRHAQIEAQKEDRPVRDGEVLTACQAVCPAGAIVFGDMSDPKSTVARWKDAPLNYTLLEELNTSPRTTYLAGLTNPHPDLPPQEAD
jgi:molybdopterin-containing oxidoreductase family iron-sulfur binding subunit